MSKAEDIGKIYALHKASEKLHDYYGSAMLSVVQFDGRDIKNAYIDGYRQAEKDFELTWEDISALRVILDDVEQEFKKGLHEDKDYIGYCKEILKRFKERKEK